MKCLGETEERETADRNANAVNNMVDKDVFQKSRRWSHSIKSTEGLYVFLYCWKSALDSLANTVQVFG